MKNFLNIVISFAISSVLQSTEVNFGSWKFWVVFALILALIAVQYMGR
jgi:hypothetical protein